MLVLIDNYDSFTYNLVQKLGEVGGPSLKMEVFRNDKVTADQVEDLKPTHIVISPGPCTPREGGVSNDIIKRFGPRPAGAPSPPTPSSAWARVCCCWAPGWGPSGWALPRARSAREPPSRFPAR